MGVFFSIVRNSVLGLVTVTALVLFFVFVSDNRDSASDYLENRVPLPDAAAIVTTAPEEGWTKENFLGSELPHLGVSFGAAVDEVDEYALLAGHEVSTSLFFKTWANHSDFKRYEFTRLMRRGIVPVLSWEPWDNQAGLIQPEYSMDEIAGGRHDDFVRSWARDIATLESPVVLRFAHEMNGHWYPWSAYRNGNSPEAYVRAWRHLHQVFEEEGASNVIWCWSVNVNRFLPNRPFESYYPGDDFVDVIGISGYSVREDDDFVTVYGTTFDELAELTEKPVLVTEIGVGGNRETRPSRIESLLTGLATDPTVIGYVWFQKSKREDWKIDATSETLRAYRASAEAFSRDWLSTRNPPEEIQDRVASLGFE